MGLGSGPEGTKGGRQERLQPRTVDCHRNRQIVDPDPESPGPVRQWTYLPLRACPSVPPEEPDRRGTGSSSLPERRLDRTHAGSTGISSGS